MSRQEFLWQLRACLNGHMPPAKIEDVIAYYEEYFLESGEEGEAAVMAELGDPREVAARILGAAPAWAPPPPVWEGAGFTNYSTQRRYHRPRSALFGLVAAVIAVALVAGILFRATGGTGNSYSYGYTTAQPEPTLPPALAAAMDVTILTEYTQLAPFSDVILDLSMASVDVIPGDSYAIQFDGQEGRLKFDNGADGLRIWEDSEQPGNATIIDQVGSAAQGLFTAPRVVITLPYGASLTDLTLRTGYGSVSVSGLSCRSLMLETKLGEMTLTDITADQLGLTVAGGALHAYDVTAKEAKLNGSLGSVDLSGCNFDFLSIDWQGGQLSLSDCQLGTGELRNSLGEINAWNLTSYGLQVNGQNGAISLWGALYGETVVTQSLGAVTIGIELARTDFSYDLQTSLGSITLDGRADRGHVVSGSDAPNSLVVQNQSGSIDVSFVY